jgi:superoxide reductase
MNNRRDFITKAVVLGAGVFATSLSACESDCKKDKCKTTDEGNQTKCKVAHPKEVHHAPKGIYYSKSNQGRWEGKAGSHAPIVTVEGKKVTVETKHGMSDAHFIVKHALLNAEGEVLGETVFTSKDKPVSTFELKEVPTTMVATSFCNLHDLWVTEYKA